MRVLLFQAPLGRDHPPVYPQGLCCIATALKDEHEVLCSDPNVVADHRAEARRLIEEFRPQVIGVSHRNIDPCEVDNPWFYYLFFLEFMQELRQWAPDATLVAGGPGFSLFPRELMLRCPAIDLGVYLEGEESFPELLRRLDAPERVAGVFYRRDGDVLFSGERMPPDVNALPIPDRSLIDIAPYVQAPFDVGVESKRGCKLNCAYCCYPILNGNRVRLREPGTIVDEIEGLVRDYGVSTFGFIDSVFDVPQEHCTAICEELIRRDLPVEWSAWYSGRGFDDEFFRLCLRAGCKVFSFSPDAYTPRTLKGLQKFVRHQDIRRVAEIFRRHGRREGVKCSFNFFVNSPRMRLWDFLRTMAFTIRLRLTLRGTLVGMGIQYIRILPNTPMERVAREQGVLQGQVDFLPDNAADYEKLFYHEPRARGVDPLFRLYNGSKELLKKALGIRTCAPSQGDAVPPELTRRPPPPQH